MALDRDSLLKPVKKLRKLIDKVDTKPTPERVHDLRTNTRRFEAMFEALSLDAQGIGKSVLKCGVQMLEHLGAQRKSTQRS
jgi:CHAD domain-containing protein